MQQNDQIGTFDIIKNMAFTVATVCFVIPFMYYEHGSFITKIPEDFVLVLLCFVFSILFDSLQRKNDFSKKRTSKIFWEKFDFHINNTEIIIIFLLLPSAIFFNGVNLKHIASLIVIVCSFSLFALRLIFVSRYLWLGVKKGGTK